MTLQTLYDSAPPQGTEGGAISILVVDIGTSGVRASVVAGDGAVRHQHYCPALPATPAPGIVEFDAVELAEATLDVARQALSDAAAESGAPGARVDPVEAVGIANQRASTVVWDRATGPTGRARGSAGRTCAPPAPASCCSARVCGWPPTRLPPSSPIFSTPTTTAGNGTCVFGTVDSWIVWQLSEEAAHVTDASNAGRHRPRGRRRVGMVRAPCSTPCASRASVLPTIVDSLGLRGRGDRAARCTCRSPASPATSRPR